MTPLEYELRRLTCVCVCVLQVLVHSDRSGDLYGSVLVDSGSAISADLLLDDSQQHVFVLTNSRVRDHSIFIFIFSLFSAVSLSVHY